MKQVIQNYRTGEIEIADVPVPLCSANRILVKNIASLISLGTERSIIALAQKNLLGKAKARPDLVKRFVDKAKKEGFVKTFKEALGRLDNPVSLGYSSAGIVVEAGRNVSKFLPGNRVACIGAGYASHAEYITVPENLCYMIPDNVTFEEASFGMLGIIALHGIRCGKVTFGESVVVIGLGLLGLLSIQILKAYGCRVIGFDIDSSKVDLAKKLGIHNVFTDVDEFKNGVDKFTSGFGADAVIITAATESNEPVHLGVEISRYGGRVVIVGVADIHPQRNEMWHKEVEIIVSKAGGAGTFDPIYENKGIDYPIGYVRWTENRNLEEFLRLISEGRVNVGSLITHKFKIEQAESVYKEMLKNKGGPYIGVILEYQNENESLNVNNQKLLERKISLRTNQRITNNSALISVGVIGAGLFGKSLLLPALKRISSIRFHTLSTSSSANTYHTAKRYGFENCTTDYREILESDEIDSVLILTPHSLHAKMVIEALSAGKHVFVEKPLCIDEGELREIIEVYSSLITHHSSMPFLMVGYNRRFSLHMAKIKEYLKNRQDPMVINYRINAGFIPPEHWVHSEEEGGGRIIGEICHFVDAMQYLTRSKPIKVYAESISGNNKTALNNDNVVIILKFEDGSVGNIVYSASGDRAFSRERIEVFFEGKTCIVNDFRNTEFYGFGKRKNFKTVSQQMGYKEELQHFFDVITGSSVPDITSEEIFSSTLSVFKIKDSLSTGIPTKL